MPTVDPARVTDLQYQVLAARRQSYDNMLWQTPVISLTAQAFLFTIALGTGAKVSRLIAGCLALIAALASSQLLAKHRYFEIYYSRLLEDVESARAEQPAHGRPPAAQGLVGWSSYHVWQAVFWVFAIAAVLACFLAVMGG